MNQTFIPFPVLLNQTHEINQSMKLTKKLGISLMCVGAGLFGMTLKGHSKPHYIGTGALLGLGLGMLGGTFSKKPKIKIDTHPEPVDED